MSPTPHAVCPHCRGQLALPDDLGPRDLVRCPLCRREFEASELIPLVPQVEIVRREREGNGDQVEPRGTPNQSRSSAALSQAGAPSSPAVLTIPAEQGWDRVDHGPRATDDPPLIQVRENLESSSTPPDRAQIVRKRYFSHARLKHGKTVSGPRRSKRRKSATSIEILKVVLGGLLAFPVAQMILWWGAGRDPFHLGPPVSRYVRYLVPEQFRAPLPTPNLPDTPPRSERAPSLLDSDSPFDIRPPDQR